MGLSHIVITYRRQDTVRYIFFSFLHYQSAKYHRSLERSVTHFEQPSIKTVTVCRIDCFSHFSKPLPPGIRLVELTVTYLQNCEEDNDCTGAQKAGRYHINEIVE